MPAWHMRSRRRLLSFPPQPQQQRGNANSPAVRKVTLRLPAGVIRLDDLPDRTPSPPPAQPVVHGGHYAAITPSRARWVALTHTMHLLIRLPLNRSNGNGMAIEVLEKPVTNRSLTRMALR
jgi:hypothetical protein